MPYKMISKRCVTLVEMMIVMFLIAMITGVVAFNYQSTLTKGKVFQTEQTIEKIKNVIALKLAEDPTAIEYIESQWTDVVTQSPLVSDPKKVIYDAWGYQFEVYTVKNEETGEMEIEVYSESYQNYLDSQ